MLKGLTNKLTHKISGLSAANSSSFSGADSFFIDGKSFEYILRNIFSDENFDNDFYKKYHKFLRRNNSKKFLIITLKDLSKLLVARDVKTCSDVSPDFLNCANVVCTSCSAVVLIKIENYIKIQDFRNFIFNIYKMLEADGIFFCEIQACYEFKDGTAIIEQIDKLCLESGFKYVHLLKLSVNISGQANYFVISQK